MNAKSDDMRRELEEIFDSFPEIRLSDIPAIDLYMDQVTTFLQKNLRGLSRDPDGDKFLTKTMINNYVKNKVLIPPVKKKYSRDHMLLLIVVYYMKSFLSIGDIRSITGPIMERYASVSPETPDRKKDPSRQGVKAKEQAAGMRESDLDICSIYESIAENLKQQLPGIREDILRQIEFAEHDFSEAPLEDRPLLQRFALICRLSAEICIRKLYIEKLLDREKE